MKTDTVRNLRKPVLIVILLFVVAAWGIIGCAAADTAKTQILVYSVGSDLESKNAASSEELMDIVKNYRDTDPNSLDIITAFGGSNKDGWRGMRIATIEQLKADAKDGKFGNGQYLYSDTNADMGSGQSLAKFFSVARSSRTADKTILILSDHGASYDGIGIDEITSNSLQMNDLDTVLRGAGISYDAIMFDACLMSSVEVGKTVQPYTRLILGSEEIQRGGYDFEKFLGPLTSKPDTDSMTPIRSVIDAYIDEDPKVQHALTMSIIDVSKMPTIQASLDELGARLLPLCDDPQGIHDLKGAYNDAVRLGVLEGSKPVSVDLVSLLEHIKKKRPELSLEIDKTIGLVRSAVVYERHNAFSKVVAGISIASPDAMDQAKYQKYGEGVKIAPNWDAFFQKMIGISSGENTVQFSSESEDTTEAADARHLPRSKAALSKPGFTSKGNGSFELRDPYHSASVYERYFLINGSEVQYIGMQPIQPDKNGFYTLPLWDGRWYYFPGQKSGQEAWWNILQKIVFGQHEKPQPLLVAMEYDDITQGGSGIYYSWIAIQDNGVTTNATLISYVNATKNEYPFEIVPYTMTDTGESLFGDSTSIIPSGSLVTSYTGGFDLKTMKSEEYTLSRTTSGPDMQIAYALLPDGTYAAGIMAYYDNNDEVLADQFRIITIKNGALVSSGIGKLG
jgi:hypothetical protein